MNIGAMKSEAAHEKSESRSLELEEVYTEAVGRYQQAVTADQHNTDQAKDDLRFVRGEQWDSKVEAERKAAGRPTLTYNHLKPFVRQVANEIRMKPPGIQVSASEDGDQAVAEVYEGLVRVIERQSSAKRVYAAAAESSARCGMGFWRIDTEYEDDDAFNQAIKIKFIRDPFSVIFDPMAEEITRRDAEYAFVMTEMSKEAFEKQYGDEDITSFPYVSQGQTWQNGEVITVCEYWVVKKKPDTLLLLSDGSSVKGSNEAALLSAAQRGLTIIKQRPCYNRIVMQYKLSGRGVIGKPIKTVFDRIPIIPVWGEEVFDGDRTWRSGVITDAKDIQRTLNYWQSAAVERLALAPKAPWLLTGTQIKGFEKEWKIAASGNPSYLPYNFDPQAGKPDRISPAPVEAGMLQQAALAVDSLKAVTGIHDASLGAKSNETSGRAILARQREGDVGTYAFVDNVMAAVEETGRVIVAIIPKLYDVPRKIRILGKKMEAKVVEINSGEIDLARGSYDVVVSAGNSLMSQRQEAAEMFTSALQAAPMLAPILIPRLISSMDLPDAEEIANEIKQLTQPQQAPQQPPPPNPKDVAQAQNYAASAAKSLADAEGQNLTNAATKLQLGMAVGNMMQADAWQRQGMVPPPSPVGYGVNPPA